MSWLPPQSGEIIDAPTPQARAAIAAVAEGRRVIFFLDELSRARQEAVNALLTLVHDRRSTS